MHAKMRCGAQPSCTTKAASTSRCQLLLAHGLRTRPSSCPGLQGASRRRALVVVAGERQTGNTATKRRLSGPPGLPPINGDDGGGGGGGGGDGWNWERTARNLLPNAFFLGMYFMITSYGGDGWGKGGGGGGDGGGGGGGGGGWDGAPDGSSPGQEGGGGGNEGEDEGSRQAAAVSEDEEPPVYQARSSGRSHYR